MALSCRAGGADQCPKLAVERTNADMPPAAECDPIRTSGRSRAKSSQLEFRKIQVYPKDLRMLRRQPEMR